MEARREGKHNEEADHRAPCTLSLFMSMLVGAAEEQFAVYGEWPPNWALHAVRCRVASHPLYMPGSL